MQNSRKIEKIIITKTIQVFLSRKKKTLQPLLISRKIYDTSIDTNKFSEFTVLIIIQQQKEINKGLNIFGMKTNNGIPAPGVSRQLPGGRINFNKQEESKPGFVPGRPKPSGNLPGGSGIKFTSSNVNSKALIKRLNKIKDQLGVFSSLNSERKMYTVGGKPPAPSSTTTTKQPSMLQQHFHMGAPPSTFGGSAPSSTFGGGAPPSTFGSNGI